MKNGTIVISGMPGAGSSSVAKKLAKEISSNYFSAGQLFKDIGNGKIKEQHYYPLFRELCDKKGLKIPQTHFEKGKEAIDLWKTDFGKSKEFHELIDRLQVALGKKGNIIIDGKLALRMNPQAGLKIWIKADIEDRAGRIASRDKIPLEKAKEIIQEREKKEREEWKKIYGFDYFEQEGEADIIINSSNAHISEIVEEILEDDFFQEGKKLDL